MRLAAGAYAIWWLALAIHPYDRSDWLLENVLVLALFGLLAGMRRWFRFSNASLMLILLFLALHTLGSHYTYSEVPYDQWWQSLTGHTLNSVLGWQRNNYDRVVHFSYGLLLAYPIREFFLRIVEVRGFWAYFLPLDFTLSTSALYELVEWAAATLFGGDLGVQYLGTQGDIWDAHKDMGLAALGALLAMLVIAALTASLRRDFAWEWSQQMKKPGAAD
ncbi:putative membrane protein [Pollutimonas bauzanensis]|uniref:Putative membrane protein n=1 Tax=Pollutimonas bauzanensis TaxID=658167 RepID=A0A1M5QVP0_9BURK|nr:putative membrane protein [Pollutimonas bauzanensis]